MATPTEAGAQRARYKANPDLFVRECLINPETNKPFELYPEERTFIRKAFILDKDGKLPFAEMMFSAPKKSGKTGFAAMCAIYTAVVLAGTYGEIALLANDYEQASSRVYQASSRIIQASPKLRDSVTITNKSITFKSTGTVIQAFASDYAGFAGNNPTLSIIDELWGFVSESSRRLFDESVPSPARRVSGRLVVSYAGFSGESDLLESLYNRGMKGKVVARDLRATKDGLLMYWTHAARSPWQDAKWKAQMRASLRPNQFLRLAENRWVSTESSFVDPDWWQACIDKSAHPMLEACALSVYCGIDASVKRDSTAVAVCAYSPAERRVRLIWHRIFNPSPKDPLDFESTIERTLIELKARFRVKAVRYDPYQMAAVSQRLQRAGVPMEEFPQSVPNITSASTNLYELIKGANLVVYPDKDIDLAISRAVAVEVPRGWKISKASASHKVDVIVAMAMAALAAVESEHGDPSAIVLLKRENAAQQVRRGVPVDQAAAALGIPTEELRTWLERPVGAQASSSVMHPTPQNAEAFEVARKLMDSGMSAESACAEAFTVHRIGIDAEALRAYHARSLIPTQPNRPLFAPAGAKRLENLWLELGLSRQFAKP